MWFEQGEGMSTVTSARPRRSAWASSKLRRTACIATRFASAFTVDKRAVTSTMPPERATSSAIALSFLLLQLIQALARAAIASVLPSLRLVGSDYLFGA